MCKGVKDIDTTKITNMDRLFMNVPSYDEQGELVFNYNENFEVIDKTEHQDIRGWNTENVTSMKQLFYCCFRFNQNIGGWNVGKVTNMEEMFYYCSEFNQDIGGWNVGKVTNMEKMFYRCYKFNQNLNGWNIKNVEEGKNMDKMLFYCSRFKEKNIENWGLTKKEKKEILYKNIVGWVWNNVKECIGCKKGGKKTRKNRHSTWVTSTQKNFGTNNQMY